jgi:glycerol-3-phosphate dehydrogenase
MWMDRRQHFQQAFDSTEPWDVIIVGGGATGVGCAVDAASRGYRTVLFEQSDFGKGTSSRSTKLAHGGVRYLRQGRIGLVRQALRERSILRRNAPHLVHSLPFLVPAYQRWETPYYGMGLALYGLLSGPSDFGRSRSLSREQALDLSPGLNDRGLRGGVVYFDGQFDDARLLINLAQTAASHGAVLLNYVQVLRTIHGDGHVVRGVLVRDVETGCEKEVVGRCVINATGAFCDALRQSDDARSRPLIAPSQGTHIVLGRSFLPGRTALMVPRTRDGRVVFAIPWHDHVLVGTTDSPIERVSLEPHPSAPEIDFLLETVGRYLARAPQRSDITSAFCGVRPLVRSANGSTTAQLSRDHLIEVSGTGLITITGGKWTTYRAMASECIDTAARVAGLPQRSCVTQDLRICGADDGRQIEAMTRDNPQDGRQLDRDLPIVAAQVRWAARHEAARTLDDILARRTRALHLNAASALRMAPEVATILAEELGRDCCWQRRQLEQFQALAASYQIKGRVPFN